DRTIPAIVYKPLSIEKRLQMLASVIQKKAGKLARYSDKVSATDLLLVDRGGLLSGIKTSEAARIVHENLVTRAVQDSGFREIWLLVKAAPQVVLIPCRVNMLAQELASFHLAIGVVRKEQNFELSLRHYLEMLGAHLKRRGFVDSHVLAGKEKYAVS